MKPGMLYMRKFHRRISQNLVDQPDLQMCSVSEHFYIHINIYLCIIYICVYVYTYVYIYIRTYVYQAINVDLRKYNQPLK